MLEGRRHAYSLDESRCREERRSNFRLRSILAAGRWEPVGQRRAVAKRTFRLPVVGGSSYA